MKSGNKKYQFPWRSGNNFQLLIDGRQFFPCMLDAINEAQTYVCLETYLMESGKVANRFIEALINAQQRGVMIYLYLDSYGSMGLGEKDRQKLLNANIQLVLYNPHSIFQFYRSLKRDHRKLLLVDGKVGFVGGAGITDEFMPAKMPDNSWHEVMVRIEGAVLHDWLELFSHSWHTTTQSPTRLPVLNLPEQSDKSMGRLSVAEGYRYQEINRSLIKRCRNAEHKVFISTPYFLISKKLRRTLRRAARQGIDVRVLVPGKISDHPWVSHASRGYYTRLLRAGVRIFEYQPRFLHAKIQLCDNWVSIGSSNLDRWNQHWNLDANQEIEDSVFSGEVMRLFKHNFTQSEEILHANWKIRPLRQRIREWFYGRFVHILEYLSRLKPRQKNDIRRIK